MIDHWQLRGLNVVKMFSKRGQRQTFDFVGVAFEQELPINFPIDQKRNVIHLNDLISESSVHVTGH